MAIVPQRLRALLELRLCLASFPRHDGFRVQATPSSCARRYRAYARRRAEFARTYVGPRLPHRRDRLAWRVNSVDLKNRLSDIETDRRDRLHAWLLRIVGTSTAPTSMALPCRWRSRPQHQKRTHAPQQQSSYPIASSAIESTSGGTLTPSARAVCRLMAAPKLVDCVTESSAGFSPRGCGSHHAEFGSHPMAAPCRPV